MLFACFKNLSRRMNLMTTTLSLSVTAQDKSATQNVRFPLYTHNKLWDSSLSSTFQKVSNLAVQIFKEAFKYIANAGLHVANSIYSLFNKHTVVAEDAAKIASKADDHVVAEDFSLQSTIDLNGVEIDLDEGIPAEENQGSWLRTAVKATVVLAAGAGLVAGFQYGAQRYGYCMPGVFQACGYFAKAAAAAGTPKA
jgi:hypothetical protein